MPFCTLRLDVECYDFQQRRSRPRGATFISEREKELELSAQSCLEGISISLLSEWDVLAFVYRNGASLVTVDQIAHLTGYESKVVGDALDRLEREKLIERSRRSVGVCFYRTAVSEDALRGRCLRQLARLSESRAGRLVLSKLLKPVRPELVSNKQSAESRK